MKISNKKTFATIALILTLTLSVTLAALPAVTAQTVEDVTTYTFVAPPAKAAVGQPALIVYWLNEMPSPETTQEIAQGLRGAYVGVTMTITAPDGTEETIELDRSDPVGSGYTVYTPSQVGEYSVQAHFPGNWRNTTSTHRWYMPSESEVRTLEVQAEPVEGWPEAPLPDDYWMRPISGASHTWSAVAGHWLGSYAQTCPIGASGGVTTNYAYGDGPESAHILWTRQLYPQGGIADERFGSEQWTLNHYQGIGFSAVIVDGQIHYTPAQTAHMQRASEQAAVGYGWQTIDLYTGEYIDDAPSAPPAFGQVYVYNSPNQHGAFAYLWKTGGITLPEKVNIAHAELTEPATQPPTRLEPSTEVDSSEITTGTLWEMIDAYTRETVTYVANVSSGTQIYGEDGSILIYNLVGTQASPYSPAEPPYHLTVWNSSAGTMIGSEDGTGYWQWRPMGGAGYGASDSYFTAGIPQMFGTYPAVDNIVHDGNLMYTLNVTLPVDRSISVQAIRDGEYVIVGSEGINSPDETENTYLAAISLKEGEEGTLLWETEFTPPYSESWPSGFFGNGMSLTAVVPEHDVVIYSDNIQLKRYAFDMKTGAKLWESEREDAWKFYGYQSQIYGDLLISGGRYSGELNAFDLRTGEIKWTYLAPLEGTESPYGRGTMDTGTVADGKIYTGVWEHSASTPLWRQPGLRCVDLETGELVWDILFWDDGTRVVADGILIARSLYDGQIYAFGKGPTKTAVTAPDTGVPSGSSVVIRGTVTDQTPTGARNLNNNLEFTLKDTPAISDEDMTDWMEYKFMEQVKPTDAEGVEVRLAIRDPQGDYYVAYETSDANGMFSHTWTPTREGTYYVTAEFKGSNAYYPSEATTTFAVDSATAATNMEPESAEPEPSEAELTTVQPTEPEPTETTQVPFISTEVAIILAVVVACIIGAAAYWTLQKRQ